jgi:UDP-3-O-[3-hydroxymyristoyl] glucosamine N-acyltransferase
LSIPDGTVISGGTLVPSTIAEAGVYTAVFPLLAHREWRHVASDLRRLRKRVAPQPPQAASEPSQEER